MFVNKQIEQSQVTATWEWHDENNGTVQWTFSNPTDSQKSVVLLRNGYYFAGAYWPIYENNAEFNTHFATKVEPLTDNGTDKNSPPLFVGEVNGKYGVYFLFTLAAGQTWSMLEGGFDSSNTPSGISVHEVTGTSHQTMCVGYSPKQVSDWDKQTGTNLQGYSPNPKTFDVVVGTINGPYIQLFNDPISTGRCQSGSGGSGGGHACTNYLDKAISDFESGSLIKGFAYLLKYIECISGISNEQADFAESLQHLLSELQ